MAKRVVSAGSHVMATTEQFSTNLKDEVAILDLKGGKYYGLDAVGARIWSLIQEPRSVEEVRDIIVGEYKVEPERCERDLIALLQSLADEGLIEVSDGPVT